MMSNVILCEQIIQGPELVIRGFGLRAVSPPSVVKRPNGFLNEYQINFFYDPMEIGTAQKVGRYPQGTFILYEPGCRHHYGNPDQPWSECWILFHGTEAAEIIRQSRIPTNTVLNIPQAQEPTERWLGMMKEEFLRYHHQPDPVILKNCLQAWLREIRRLISNENPELAIPEEFVKLKKYLDDNCPLSISLPELAGSLKLSVPHFCREFKRYFGTSAIDYLIRQRMQRAAYLLSDHNLRIGEISRKVGYDDVRHFSKLFRKHYGCSPRKMRNQQKTPSENS